MDAFAKTVWMDKTMMRRNAAEILNGMEKQCGQWINVRNNNVANCDLCGARGRTWIQYCNQCSVLMNRGNGGNGKTD